MAKSKWPNRNIAARSFHQLRRFCHLINVDKVFGTRRRPQVRQDDRADDRGRGGSGYEEGGRGRQGLQARPIGKSSGTTSAWWQTLPPPLAGKQRHQPCCAPAQSSEQQTVRDRDSNEPWFCENPRVIHPRYRPCLKQK